MANHMEGRLYVIAKDVTEKAKLMKSVYGWAYFFQGVFFLLFAVSTNLYVGAIMLLLMRVFGGIIIPLDTTLIQHHTPSENLGRFLPCISHFTVPLYSFPCF